ncbi:MAG: ABC transporter permease [Candidatus Woesearchaeota archaeon]
MLKHLKMHYEYMKLAINSALEYRTNFIIQTTSMFLNDVVWIIFWTIIFSRFNNINGWNLQDMLLLYSIVTIAYGMGGVFFGNRNAIAKIIVEGRLDYYLTLPKNILYHLICSKCSWYALGDFLLGLVLAIMFLSISQVPLFILLIILSTTIIIAFGVLVGSLTFYIDNSEETTTSLWNSLIGLSTYPLSIYQGVTRVIILLIIPAGFISGVPVELLKSFNWTWLLYMLGFTLLITIVSITVFYKGLKKYESGNLLYVRT